MSIMRALLIALSVALACAQEKPVFEVASIRPGSLPVAGGRSRFTGERLTITNLTLREMIIQAWGVRPFQVLDGPAWADSARYDILAKAENKVQHGEVMRMLQSLLTDR